MLLAKTSTRFVTGCGVLLMTVGILSFGYVPAVEYMYLVYGVGYGKLRTEVSNEIIRSSQTQSCVQVTVLESKIESNQEA